VVKKEDAFCGRKGDVSNRWLKSESSRLDRRKAKRKARSLVTTRGTDQGLKRGEGGERYLSVPEIKPWGGK